jgi:repressor LexA
MARKNGISEKQENILEVIWNYLQDKSRPPTVREIVSEANISSTSVVDYNLGKLEDKGLITREPGVSRGLQVTENGRMLLEGVRAHVRRVTNMITIPLVGDIVASEPVTIGHDDFNSYDPELDVVELSESMLPDKNLDSIFALRVRGDSMIDAMVSNGDVVILRQTKEARDGDMVAVWLPESGEMTLKNFYKEGNQVRLQPANPHMDPIYVHAGNVEVQGKVMMVVRNTA